jgi:HK97 family phage prohead protease
MPKKIEVSVDEVLDARKDFSDGEGGIYKAHISPRSWNDEERSAIFVMSAETEDRYRDIVVQSGIDTTHFEKNPVALFGHRSWDMPIGTWSDLRMVKASPRRTEGKLTFTAEGTDDMADRTARNVKAGVLKACSIGFRPRMVEKILDPEGNWTYGYKFAESELFECSVVSIPAVREALIKGAGNLKEIIEPEVIEEFLEHLKANPAIAKMIDRSLYEDVYREATGNKTTSILTTSIELDTKSLERLESIAARMEKAATGVVERDGESEVIEHTRQDPEPDPVAKELELNVEGFLKDFAPKVEEIDEPERKGALTKLMDGIRSLFKAEEPTPPAEPEKADPSVQKALAERLEKIAERNKLAA